MAQRTRLAVLPCLDTDEMATARRQELDISRQVAATLGESAVEAVRAGHYFNSKGVKVDWSRAVRTACAAKRSISPDAVLPSNHGRMLPETRVQICNET